MKFVGVVFSAAFLMAVGGAHKLEYKSTGPTPVHYRYHSSMETVQTVNGQKIKVTLVSSQTLSMTSAKADSVLVFSVTVDTAENKITLPGGKTEKVPSITIGKVVRTRLLPNGEELSSEWADTQFAKSSAASLNNIGGFFFRLPSTSADVGATWTEDKSDTTGAPGTGEDGSIVIAGKIHYKLTEMEDVGGVSCARIEFTGKYTMTGSLIIQANYVSAEGTGTITGSFLFDCAGGKVMKSVGASTQNFTMSTAGENGMSIPMSQKIKYDVSLVK
ncbi:MAG TPA: hypothetical protein VLX91_17045 [Candidatus Acidoferrales bacterium]|nr:hypothetical protein [Candidatus Acidoferrales bacterium]